MKLNKDLAEFMFKNIVFFSEDNLKKNGIFAFKFRMGWAEDFFQNSVDQINLALDYLDKKGLIRTSFTNKKYSLIAPQKFSECALKMIQRNIDKHTVYQ